MQSKKNFTVWWRLLRPHTLTASFIPVLIGTSLALEITKINFGLFFSMLIASILIQSATNMFNEYYDYKRGLDTKESVGIGGTIVRDGVKPNIILNLALIFLFIATVLGVYICHNTTWYLALIGLICMSVGYLYTGGPYPIAYTPFGEIISGVFMGLLIIGISFYIQTDTITYKCILVSIPTTILIGAILMSNNIRDLDRDKEMGRHTLAILLGKKNAINFLAFMFIVSFIWIVVLIILNLLPVWTLLVFLSIFKAKKAVKGFIGKKQPIEMLPAMKFTAQTNTLFGFFLFIGIFIDHLLG